MAPSPDWVPDELWRALGALAAFFGVSLAFKKWLERRAEKRAIEWASKADAQEMLDVHERISRHKQETDEKIDKNHTAILDLYGKHERTQSLILEGEKRSADRHSELLHAITGLRRR